jgi:hypothetical protein
MRDVLNWWKARPSQLLVLLSLAILLAWQNLELRRGEGFFRKIVGEVRESFEQQELKREVQFARLLRSIEDRMSRIDEAIVASRCSRDREALLAEPGPRSPGG